MILRVLVIEDGTEYVDGLTRFAAGGDVVFERAGSGPQALARLSGTPAIDAVVLDMRFDRAPPSELLGDASEVAEQRFNGDAVAARRHLEDHQGLYVLSALRQSGYALPVVLSYDFGPEPKRWERLKARYAPVDYAGDDAGPADLAARVLALVGGRAPGTPVDHA